MTRPEFEQIIAAAPRQSLKRTIHIPTGTLANGSSRNIDFFAPSGVYSQLVGLSFYFEKPSGAGTSHYVEMKYSNATNSLFFTVSYAPANNINYQSNSFIGTTLSFSPSPVADFRLAHKDIFFDATTGLRFTYYNNSGNLKDFGTSTNYIEFYTIDTITAI